MAGGSYTFTGGIAISGGTVNFSTGAALAASSLTETGGTLTGTDTLTVTGATTWTGGVMGGSGATIAQGGLTLGGTAANTTYRESLSARTLENFATATLAGNYNDGGLFFDTGGTLDNEPGATFDIVNDAQFWANGGSPGGGTIVNQGTFAKTGGAGTTVGANWNGGAVAFDQSGSGAVQVESGGLGFNGGGTLGGTGLLTAVAGAALGFGGGTFTIAASSGIAGAGSVNFSGGTVNDAGSYDITGTTSVSGGTANLFGR